MKVEEETDPQDEINVYLKVIKTLPLKIKRSETVSQLKTKLAKMEGGADPELQKLFFCGDHLQDNKMLAEYSISSGNTLSLYLSPELRFQIFVKTPEGKISLLVKSSDSTQSIKARIQDAEAIPAAQQTLVFDGRVLEEDNYLQAYNIKMNSRLEDHRTLASYKIRSKCTLHLSYPTMKISVWDPTEKYVMSLEVHRADKAADVMQRIKQKFLGDDGEYGFVFRGKVMQADRSLEDYGVEGGCVLQMVRVVGRGNKEYVLYV